VRLATTLRLVDASAAIRVASGAPARIEDVEVSRDRRAALVLTSPGRWSLPARIPAEGVLRFALSVQPASAPVEIRIGQRSLKASDALVPLLTERWRGDGGWSERRLAFGSTSGAEAELEISIEGPAATVALGDPEILGRPDADKPNVILYVIDCLRADHVGSYGYPRPTTPAIDRLARDGVVFESVHACASWTKPAVGCLFTSLYPVYHGAQTIDDVLDPGNLTLAEAFRSAGYTTAAWVANPFVSANPFGLTRGFGRVVQTLDKPPKVNINDLPADAADITRGVLPWLRENRGQRFFLYLHSLDLHAEYRRRPPFDRVFVSRERTGAERQVDLYDNELAYNDRELGRLVEALKREGLYDRTLVVVTADHGEEFGEHGFTRHGHTLFEALLHVPLVVKLPGSTHAGARIGALSSSLDIAPTLLDAAGLARPASFQGRSLRPSLAGIASPDRRAVFAEQLSPKEVLYAARDERYKYIYQLVPEPGERLFDLSSDPEELHDLLPAIPKAAEGLLTELLEFMQIGQAGLHVSVSSADPAVRFRIEASTGGAFGDVQRFALAAGETLAVAPDRKKLDYSFTAGSLTRHLVVRTEPVGAEVRLAVSSAGRPVAVAAGGDGRVRAERPFVARPAELQVSLTQAAALMKTGDPGVRVWYVAAPAAGRKASIDPELEQKLKALGYIE
jgi:arylsulfatase A-like enzyme